MNVQQPSIAARILKVIETSPSPIDTSRIYDQVDEAENITIVSVTCRDLMLAGKVHRVQRAGRWHYAALQPDLLGATQATAAAEDLEQVVAAPTAPAAPRKRTRAQRICGRRADTTASADNKLKLRTLDKLIALFADDIADVLRAIRKDVETLE